MIPHELHLQALARALGGEVNGSQVQAPGPGHSARDRSLSIKPDPSAPDGFVVNSFAGDDPIACKDYVRSKAGIEPFKANGKRKPAQSAGSEKPKAKVVAEYDYTDEKGELLYQVCRLEPKSFRQRRPDGKGGWIFSVKDCRRVPYRLADLQKYPDATVFVCEGEKDADRVASLGHCATTVACGDWTDDCVNALAGRDCVILEDNDEAGRKKAQEAAAALHSRAKSIRIVRLPGLPEKGDVSDWLDADPRNVDKLADACFDAPLWTPDNVRADDVSGANGSAHHQHAESNGEGARGEQPNDDLGEWDAGDEPGTIPPRQWLLGNQFCRGFISSIVAAGGAGKSALRLVQFISMATGRSLCGQHVFRRSRVLLISLEDDRNELQRRTKAVLDHYNIPRSELKGWLFCASPKLAKLAEMKDRARSIGPLERQVRNAIERRKPDIVSLDPFIKTHSLEENDSGDMDFVCDLLARMAIEFNIAVDSPHHVHKGQIVPGDADAGRGSSGIKDAGRLVYTLVPMSEAEAKIYNTSLEDRRAHVRLDTAKVNIAASSNKAEWFHLVSVPIGNCTDEYPNGDTIQVAEPWSPPEIWADLSNDLLNRVLTAIDAGLPDGNRYSDAARAIERGAWKVVLEHAPDKTEHQAREIIKTWVKNGVLESRSYNNPKNRNPEKGLFLDTTKRPGGSA